MIKFEQIDFWPYILAVALIWLVWIFRKKQGSATALLHGLALASLCFATLKPYVETKGIEKQVLALIDLSESLDADLAEQSLERLKALENSGISINVLPFAGIAAEQSMSLNAISSYEALRNSKKSVLNSAKTNLVSAIQQAGTLGTGSMILLTDGFETDGSIDQLLEQAGNDLRFYPLVPEITGPRSQEFKISNIFAPIVAPAQKSVSIRVALENTSQTPRRGRLLVKQNGANLAEKIVELNAHSSTVVTIDSDPSIEGISEVVATLAPEQKELSNSEAKLFISGEEREKILLVNGSEEDQTLLKRVLNEQAYQLTSIIAQDKSSLPKLTDYSVVILNNTALKQLPSGSDAAIAKYTRAGGGLLMIGGNRSFGLGGYIDTEIEKVLPVKLVPPETVKKRLNVALQLVMDKSRSMATDDKLEFAKEAARETIKNLKNEDYVGVIGFDASPFVVVKLGLLAQIREQAMTRVGRLFAAGRTNLFPAMDEARRALDRVPAGRKHMIVLTDGIIPDGGPHYPELVRQMRLQGITVSTVLLGDDVDPQQLKEMAEIGGGSFYQTRDPRALPRIFVADLKTTTGEKTLKEDQEFNVRLAGERSKITALNDFPALKGYVETKSKETANLDLEVSGSETTDPLLASWKIEQGKSVAFTSDANARWSSRWASWSDFRTFWTEVIDFLRPEQGEQAKNIKFDLSPVLDRGTLKLDLSVFTENISGAAVAELTTPKGQKQNLNFSPVTAGRYQAELKEPIAGDYKIAIKLGSASIPALAFNLSADLFGEKKGQGYNLELLNRLAFKTSGTINPSSEQFNLTPIYRSKRTDLSWIALSAALMLLCLEILLRERPRLRSTFR